MTPQEVFNALQRFDEEYIPFPPFVVASQAIELNLSLYRETGLTQHLIILGESGTGKSSLCAWLGQKYPGFSMPDRDVVPVLIVAIPPSATIASVAEAMLTGLGDPSPWGGTISSKTNRVVKLCHGCRVEMVLFDEAQHIHDRGQAATHYMVGDWLKSLIDALNLPTVFLGLPRLEQLLQVNEQLRRRFSRRIRLALGQSDAESIHNECLQLFMSLGVCVPLPLTSGSYGWEEMGMRLYYASDGRVAYLKKLLAGALRLAMESQLKEIDPAVLQQAFINEIWWDGVGKLNPFEKTFEFRRLDRGNEPFERGSYGVRQKREKSPC
jgi:hypothetical protein